MLLLDSSCYICMPQYGTAGTCRLGNQLTGYQLRDLCMSSILCFFQGFPVPEQESKIGVYIYMKCLLPYSQKFTLSLTSSMQSGKPCGTLTAAVSHRLPYLNLPQRWPLCVCTFHAQQLHVLHPVRASVDGWRVRLPFLPNRFQPKAYRHSQTSPAIAAPGLAPEQSREAAFSG